MKITGIFQYPERIFLFLMYSSRWSKISRHQNTLSQRISILEFSNFSSYNLLASIKWLPVVSGFSKCYFIAAMFCLIIDSSIWSKRILQFSLPNLASLTPYLGKNPFVIRNVSLTSLKWSGIVILSSFSLMSKAYKILFEW